MPIRLISTTQLFAERESGLPIIIDARRSGEYARGHIPGAISVAWEEWCADAPEYLGEELAQPGYWGLLKEFDDTTLERKLSATGIASDAPIVVYANGAATRGREGRIAWMLLYYGAHDVAILDGGFNAWSKSLPSETKIETLTAAKFTVRRQAERRVLLKDLRRHQQNNSLPLMIDTRTRKEFEGECYDYMPRKGTMPNSILLAYDSIFDSDGNFISREKYLHMIPEQLSTAENVVAVCEVGVRASTVALLHEIYTQRVIPVYDGSIMEWAAETDLPMSNLKD